jgi:HEAT repeat protein
VSARAVLILLLCVSACAGCGTREKDTPELIHDLKSGEERERMVAVRTLPNREGEAAQVVPALIEALKDKEADIRRSAAIKLGTMGDQAKDAVPALQTALSDRDARVREAASKALTRIDPAKFPTAPKTSAPRKK